MIRRAFAMRLKPGGLEGYVKHHSELWQEMKDEIERAGIAQITIFENDPQLFLYSEIRDPDAWDKLWATEVHGRWGELMNQFMEIVEGGAPDAVELRQIFNLESGSS